MVTPLRVAISLETEARNQANICRGAPLLIRGPCYQPLRQSAGPRGGTPTLPLNMLQGPFATIEKPWLTSEPLLTVKPLAPLLQFI